MRRRTRCGRRLAWPRCLKTSHHRSGRSDPAEFGKRKRRTAKAVRRSLKVDAEGGTRTPTSLRPLAPEASASTSSTTSAGGRNGNGKYGKQEAGDGDKRGRSRLRPNSVPGTEPTPSPLASGDVGVTAWR